MFGSEIAFGVKCMRLPAFSFHYSLATDEESREKMSWCKPQKQTGEERRERRFSTPLVALHTLCLTS